MALYLTNIAQMQAVRMFSKTSSELNTTYARLSSGKRINSAKDDPAGLMIADRLTAQINGYNQGARNLGDGIAVAQTIEGALDEYKNMLQRIRTLSVQAASGTYTDDDREMMDLEVVELCKELNRISRATTFGGAQILNGNNCGLFNASGTIDIAVSGQPNDKISIPGFSEGFSISGIGDHLGITFSSSTIKSDGEGGWSFSLTSAQNAEGVIAQVDKYLSEVSSYQGTLGAVQNRMESAIRLNQVMSENLSDARSRIEDTDYAEEASKLAQLSVRQHILATLFPRIMESKKFILSLLQF